MKNWIKGGPQRSPTWRDHSPEHQPYPPSRKAAELAAHQASRHLLLDQQYGQQEGLGLAGTSWAKITDSETDAVPQNPRRGRILPKMFQKPLS